MPSVNNFPHKITVAAKTTLNVSGSQVASYATSYASVPALVTDASARLQLIYAQRNITIDKVIFVTKALSTQTGDIIKFGAKNFIIRGNMNPAGSSRIFEIHCLELTGLEIVVEELG